MCVFYITKLTPKLVLACFFRGKIIKCGENTMKFGIFFDCFFFLWRFPPTVQQWFFFVSLSVAAEKIWRWQLGWLHSRSFFWEVGSCRIPWRIHGTGILTYTFTLLLLVGGWTNPSEKYARQNGFIFPKVRDENYKKYVKSIPSLPFQKKKRSNVGEDTMDTKGILYET